MNKKQENRFSMLLALKKECNSNKTIWETIPAFATQFGVFEGVVTDIEGFVDMQNRSVKFADIKQKEEDEMIDAVIKISSAMFAFASVANKGELKEQSRFSPSGLRLGRDTEALEAARTIHSLATANLEDLADYGITQAMLDQLKKETDDYEDIINQPTANAKTRGMASRMIDEKLAEATKILTEQLDKLIELFKDSHPVFYNSYKAARVIGDM
jgi:hypothetical protein